MLEEKGGIPVVGVVPYMQISLEDEDSLTTRFAAPTAQGEGLIDIAVIRFPRIANLRIFPYSSSSGTFPSGMSIPWKSWEIPI